MDMRIRLSKVENVTCWRRGLRVDGTLHLTSDHLIFRYELPHDVGPIGSKETAKPHVPQYKESWITYPMISHCVYRPAPPASHHPPSLRLRCRDFTFVSFHFLTDQEARSAYDNIKTLTCKRGKLNKLYAFNYHPPKPEKEQDGWNLYDPRKEFARQGISAKNTEKGWRITDINKDYVYSPTYPSLMVVPSSISDNVLNYSVKFRSKARIPALTYLHPINNCSITRCAQPLTGIRMNRNPQDEKLVAAIFATSKISITTFRSAPVTPIGSRSTSDLSESQDDTKSLDTSFTESQAELAEDKAIEEAIPDEQEASDGRRVYGAQQRNLIVDARPTVNAYAQQVTGAGSENMEFYKPAAKAYLGIENIHTMRKSLKAVVDALKDSDITSFPPNREALASSGWLGHIANMMDGAGLIARTIGIQHSHVLIHCSDGWDRTSQLSALAQICLDPYYRTLDGFIILIEKDWLSFGHMFRRRSGHLNSEKWFEIENERIATRQANLTSSTSGSGNAFENALSKAQSFFNKKNDDNSSESDPEGLDVPPPSSKHAKDDPFATQISETSPIFHQFLDATWQLLHQYPTRFEFNERFLRRLLYHLYSCQYGTFLYDNEKERIDNKAKEKTRSVWDYFLSRRQEFMNPNYDDEIDDHNPSKERLIFPKKDQVRWWAEVFGRSDKEMNGLAPGPVMKKEQVEQPTLIGVESAEGRVNLGKSTVPAESSESGAETPVIVPSTASDSTAAATQLPPPSPVAAPQPAPPTKPEVDTDPLGAGAVFGSSVSEATRSEGRRSNQLNGLTRGLGRLGFGGSASPSGSRTPVGSEELGTEMK